MSVQRRRRWPLSEKERIVAAALEPGAIASEVARAAGIHASQLYRWRRDLCERTGPASTFAAVTIAPAAVSPAPPVGMIYLASSEWGFRYGGLMVFQAQLARRLDSVPLTRDYTFEHQRGMVSDRECATPHLGEKGSLSSLAGAAVQKPGPPLASPWWPKNPRKPPASVVSYFGLAKPSSSSIWSSCRHRFSCPLISARSFSLH
jgi:hypothetical protein